MWKSTKRILLSSAMLTMLAVPAYAQTSTYPDLKHVMDSTMSLVDSKLLDQALIKLSEASPADQQTYEYRFLEARLLTWAGKYGLAGDVFENLLVEFPNNYDVMVAYGFLEFFRGNLGKAENHFNKVIEMSPAYLDAYEGLRRVYEIRNSSRSVSYSTLSDSVSCKRGQVLTPDGACTPAP